MQRHKHLMLFFRPLLCLILLTVGMGCGADNDDDMEDIDSAPNIYHVSIQGDDDNDGESQETAFRNIAHAFQLLGPGDTVLIYPGTYHEELSLEGIGSADALITVRGEDGTPILDGQQEMNLGIWCEEGTNILFDNLEIQNYTDIGIGTLYSDGVTLRNIKAHDNGHNAQMKDWEIEGYGIHADESTNIVIENCEAFRNGPKPKTLTNPMGTGIDTYSLSDSVIRNNRSYENTGGGILVEDGVNILVEGNECYSNDLDASADGWWDGGLWLDGGHDVVIRDNVFRDNKGPGIEVSDEDDQKPYGYVLERNQCTGNYWGMYLWNFGTTDLPPENILRMVDNEISGNARGEIWIEP